MRLFDKQEKVEGVAAYPVRVIRCPVIRFPCGQGAWMVRSRARVLGAGPSQAALCEKERHELVAGLEEALLTRVCLVEAFVAPR